MGWTVTLVRVPRTRAATLAHTFYAVDGEAPIDASGTVTVAVTDATGAEVALPSADADHAGPDTGRYTVTLPAQASVSLLDVAWTAILDGGVSVVEHDRVEICGGRLFDLARARAWDSSLADIETFPTARLAEVRTDVEQEVEHITDRAWTVRYARVSLSGVDGGDVVLSHPDDDRTARHIRAIRSVTVGGVALGEGELGALVVRDDGTLRRGSGVWPAGDRNVIVEYEYGLDGPEESLVRAMLERFRYLVHHPESGIPDRADSYTTSEGATYRLADVGTYQTGLPEVDAVYGRLSARPSPAAGAGESAGGRSAPASRTLSYQVQRSSLFHGRWS